MKRFLRNRGAKELKKLQHPGASHTRQSDALTSPSEWLVFFHLLLFLFISGARRISLRVRRGCDCLEMKS